MVTDAAAATGDAQLVLVPSVVKNLELWLVCDGASALNAVLAVVCPVPPLAIGSVPVTPVVRGKPVALVNTAADGVPRLGVTSTGLFDRTTATVPVDTATPVPPLVTASVPVTPVVKGKPVALVRTLPAATVPNTGVTSVGDVAKTSAPVPVSSVTAAARLALDGVAKKVATPVPRPLIPVETGRPVALVKIAALGVPRFGVLKAGDVVIATDPLPLIVYSPSTPPLS